MEPSHTRDVIETYAGHIRTHLHMGPVYIARNHQEPSSLLDECLALPAHPGLDPLLAIVPQYVQNMCPYASSHTLRRQVSRKQVCCKVVARLFSGKTAKRCFTLAASSSHAARRFEVRLSGFVCQMYHLETVRSTACGDAGMTTR